MTPWTAVSAPVLLENMWEMINLNLFAECFRYFITSRETVIPSNHEAKQQSAGRGKTTSLLRIEQLENQNTRWSTKVNWTGRSEWAHHYWLDMYMHISMLHKYELVGLQTLLQGNDCMK